MNLLVTEAPSAVRRQAPQASTPGHPLARLLHWKRRTPQRRNAQVEALELETSQVRESLEALTPVSTAVEQRFLQVGAHLEEVVRTSNELIQDSENLIQLATGGQGSENAIRSAIDLLLPPLVFLQDCQTESESLNTRLMDFLQQIKITLRSEHTFQQTVEPLRFVQTLFRVESASCAPEVREMFLALVGEIEKLHHLVRGTFRDQFAKLHQTHQTLKSIITGLASTIARQRTVTLARRAEIERSLQSLREDDERHRLTDLELGRVSRLIAGDTGSVVFALQFQDIINQKLQHVHEAVHAMEQARQRTLAAPDGTALGLELRFIEQVGRIVVGQVAQVEKELSQAETRISEGVRAIQKQLGELDGHCLSVNPAAQHLSGNTGLVQKLLEAFAEVDRLIQETASAAAKTHEDIRPVGEMASDVTDLLHSLSREMHLIGLNAQVQAAQVGTGTGLEVLSSRTSIISTATNSLSAEVARELNALHEGLGQVIATFSRLQMESAHHRDTLAGERPRRARDLGLYQTASEHALSETARLVKRLHQETQPLVEIAHFEHLTGDTLIRLSAAVSALSLKAGSMADAIGAPQAATEQTNAFAQRYTMSSEREVHRTVVDRASGDGNSEPVAENPRLPDFAAGELDLFDSPADPAATVEPPTPAPAKASDDAFAGIDLWLEDPTPGPKNETEPETPVVPGSSNPSTPLHETDECKQDVRFNRIPPID